MRLILVMMAMAFAGTAAGHPQAGNETALMFVADMQGRFVAPAPVDTAAASRATGVLIGNQFTVHGSFTGLSSALRDIAKKPDDPGVHLHRGAPGVTTPYFHGLQVKLNADERSGIFYGVAILTDEQKKALLATESYIDIHTVKFGPGEVRDQWRPLDAAAAASRLSVLGTPAPLEPAACHLAAK
jgi:hypothetical protein